MARVFVVVELLDVPTDEEPVAREAMELTVKAMREQPGFWKSSRVHVATGDAASQVSVAVGGQA